MSDPSPKHVDATRPWYVNKLNLILGSVTAAVASCLVGLTVLGFFLPDPPAKEPAPKLAASPPAPPSTAATSRPTGPAASSAPPAATAGTAPAPGPADPDSMYCKVTNVGTYYLKVTSAQVHNFRACAGADPYPGTTDDLFKLPQMDRRCTLGLDYTSREGALVAVYSDTTPANLAAAKQFCDANGGTP